MNARKIAPWLGWVVAGVLGVYIAVDKSRVSSPAAPFIPARAPVAAPSAAADASAEPLPQASVDPAIRAALLALSINAPAPPAEPLPVAHADVPSPSPPASPAPSSAPPSPTPTPEARGSADSDTDKVAALVPVLEQMAEESRRLNEGLAHYGKNCVGTTTVPYRDAYGSQVQGTLSNRDLPECASLKAEMAGLKFGLERKGVEVLDTARKTGVLPGVIRRLAEKYRLQTYLKP